MANLYEQTPQASDMKALFLSNREENIEMEQTLMQDILMYDSGFIDKFPIISDYV